MSLVPSYPTSPANASVVDTTSPQPAKTLAIHGLQPRDGSLELTKGCTVILDHSMITEWSPSCETFTTMRVAVVEGSCVMHMTRVGSYITKNPAASILFPQMVTLMDETQKEPALVVAAQGNVYGGNENALGDEIWFKVVHGKSYEPKSAVWLGRGMIKSFDGPPSNDLGGRKWKSHASSYLARETQTRFLGLETVAKVEAYAARADKNKIHEKVFDQTEKAMRTASSKMEEATANSFIEEHLPKITFFREAYEAQASALNVPMEDRFRVASLLPERLSPVDDAQLVAQHLAEFQADFKKFADENPERGEAWGDLIEAKIADLLTSHSPSMVVMSSSPVKGPADLEKEKLLERARLAVEVKQTDMDAKVASKTVTPAKNELLGALQRVAQDDMMDWSDVDRLYPLAESKKDPAGPGTSQKDAVGDVAAATKEMGGGTMEYLSSDSSPAGSPEQLPPARSSKLRMGDPAPPKPKLEVTRSGLRERKAKTPPPALPTARVPKVEPKQEPPAGKRKYEHTDIFMAKQAATAAARAAKQMKELSSGANAQRFDITEKVKPLPTTKEVDTAAKRKLEEQLKELEIKFANLQALKCSETEALKNEVKAVQASSAMRVSAAVADQLKESAESRAAAFREGMAYALSTFKEMHAMHKN